MSKSPRPDKQKNSSPRPARDTATQESYDDKPYPSYPYPLSQAEHVAAMATLLKLKPVPMEKARVLELGCAGGGNLFPTAVKYPHSTCLGIDLSPVQIREAEKHTSAMGLTNIRFEALDIMDLDSSYGTFDYIICHGVFSWVPDFVRERILDICKKNLSPHGIAMITFNTLPGWASLGAVRDMLMRHTRQCQDNAKKIAQAKSLLSFLYKFVPEKANIRGAVVQAMESFNRPNSDSYILHEYLEHNNKPFFFEEFNDALTQHNLQYLGDSVLDKMFTGNLGAEADALLSQIKDPIKREQYLDFISNRQFRWALVGKQGGQKPGVIDTDSLGSLYFSTHVERVDSKSDPEKGTFVYALPGVGIDYTSLTPVMTAIIETLIAAKKRAMSLAEIQDVVSTCGFDENAMSLFPNTVLLLCFHAVLDLHVAPSCFTTEVSQKPKAFDLARYQASQADCTWVTSLDNKVTVVSTDEVAVLRQLDGTRTREALGSLAVLESLCAKKLLSA